MASIISASTTSATALNLSGDTTGILQLATGATPTTAVTIDASQNVGIGTASPSSYGKLAIALSATGSATNNVLGIYQSGGVDAAALRIAGYRYTGTAQTAIDFIQNSVSNFQSNIAFSTDSGSGIAERMRIDSSGNVLVGATSLPTNAGGIFSQNGVSSRGYKTWNYTSFGTNQYSYYWTGSALQAWIDGTNVGNVTLVSDYRIKKDIVTQDTPAIARINQLRPVTYERADYKEIYKADGVAREGFIAHELQAIIPSAVEGEKDCENQIQSLNLDALCSVMVKAIQELKAIIDTQQQRITALEAK